MSNPRRIMQTDVVIVGSGPGWATVARELSRKGKKVIICEAGAYHKQFGYSIFLVSYPSSLLAEQPLPCIVSPKLEM